MAGRNHIPAHALNTRPHLRHPQDNSLLLHLPHHPPSHSQTHLLEERLVAQNREIELLLSDNQRLAAAHVALKQDVAATEQEILRLSSTASSIKADRDAQVREVYERFVKLEVEARSVNGLAAEVDQVRADIEALRAERKTLADKLKEIDVDLSKTRSELHQLPVLEAEIEAINKEIQRGRAAIEYEKKMQATNTQISEAMEKSTVSMAREIDQLHSELANAEKMAMAAAAAVAAATPGYMSLQTGYGGSDPYSVHQMHGGVIPNPHYGPVAVPHVLPPGPCDMQLQQQIHRS